MRRVVLLVICFLVFSFMLLPAYNLATNHPFLYVKGDSSSAWWDTDWQYRICHVIWGASNAGIDYQIQIVAINSSGTDGGGKVYIDNQTRSDFGDVRFVANDGSTLLSYWAESVFDGENATFWVKVSDDLSASYVTIWMYYGNPTATSQSNGTNTFVVFDDFEGSTIDNSTWTVIGQVTTSNVFAFTGTQCMKQGLGSSQIYLTNMPVASNFAVGAWFRDTPSVNGIEAGLMVQSQDCKEFVGYDSSRPFDLDTAHYFSQVDFYAATYWSISDINRTAAFHQMEIEYTDRAYMLIDGVMQTYKGTAGSPIYISLGSNWAGAIGNAFWDSFYIRKCVNPEPVQGSWDANAANIAVTGITSSKTVMGQGYELNLTVASANLDSYEEEFNLTVYASLFVDSQNITLSFATSQNVTLLGENSTYVPFTLNTTDYPYGNYTISAYAWSIGGETNTTINNYTKGTIAVTIPGDIDGDFKVDLSDLVLLANAYGTNPNFAPKGDHRWSPNADIDDNGVVGLSDLVILATHYNKHYP